MSTALTPHVRGRAWQWRAASGDGWLARLPRALALALCATLVYGEAQRLCPPPEAWRSTG